MFLFVDYVIAIVDTMNFELLSQYSAAFVQRVFSQMNLVKTAQTNTQKQSQVNVYDSIAD